MLASRPVAKQLFKALQKGEGEELLQPNEQAAEAAGGEGAGGGGAVATVARNLKRPDP